MTVTDTVLEFFKQRRGIPGATLEEQLACHYLDVKVIDSMGIIEMIAEFETAFGIRFSAEDLQSTDFQTVGGVIALIERLRATSPQ
jgi:acyl carrier protein